MPADDSPATSPPAPPQPAVAPAGAPQPFRPIRSLRKNILYAVSGTGFMNVCQFAVVVLITKFASAEVLGQYVWGLTIATVWATFCSLQLRAAYISDTRNEFTFGCYSAVRVIGILAAGVILGGLILWRCLTEYTALSVLAIFVGACLGKLAITSSEVYWAAFQRRERLDLVAKSTMLRGLVMLGAFGLFVPAYYVMIHWFEWLSPKRGAHGTALACLTYAFGWAAVNWFYERRIIRHWSELNRSFTWSDARRLIVHSLPLGLITMIIAACEAIPRLVVERYGEATKLGYFGALTYVVFPANLVVIQVGLAAANRLALYSQSNIKAYLRLLTFLALFAAGCGAAIYVLMWFLGEWILNVLYKPEYAAYHAEFLIIVAAQCITLLASVCGVATTQMRLFWSQVPLQIAILAATWIAAEITIPADPLRGAAQTTLVRAIVQTGLYAVFLVVNIGFRRRLLAGMAVPAAPPAPAGPAENGAHNR